MSQHYIPVRDAWLAARQEEILDPGQRRATLDESEAGDQAVGGRGCVARRAEASRKRAEFDEAACVEQRLGTLPCIELAAVALALHALDATHLTIEGTAALEFTENPLPSTGTG